MEIKYKDANRNFALSPCHAPLFFDLKALTFREQRWYTELSYEIVK